VKGRGRLAPQRSQRSVSSRRAEREREEEPRDESRGAIHRPPNPCSLLDSPDHRGAAPRIYGAASVLIGIQRGGGCLPGIGAACLRSEMDRIRDGRRGGVSVGGVPPPPPPRRRLRSNGGGGPRDSPRSERRRGERLMLNGGGGCASRDDGDDISDESLGDDDDDAEQELVPRYHQQRRSPSTAPPPSSPPPPGGGHHSSSSSGGGGYHNHHHGQHHQMQWKGGSNPIVSKAVDEMIGVPVPRKARSGRHSYHAQRAEFSLRRFHPDG
jgi:hypothetical protein